MWRFAAAGCSRRRPVAGPCRRARSPAGRPSRSGAAPGAGARRPPGRCLPGRRGSRVRRARALRRARRPADAGVYDGRRTARAKLGDRALVTTGRQAGARTLQGHRPGEAQNALERVVDRVVGGTSAAHHRSQRGGADREQKHRARARISGDLRTLAITATTRVTLVPRLHWQNIRGTWMQCHQTGPRNARGSGCPERA